MKLPFEKRTHLYSKNTFFGPSGVVFKQKKLQWPQRERERERDCTS